MSFDSIDLLESYPPSFLFGLWNVVFQEGVRGNHFLFDAVQPIGTQGGLELEVIWAKLLSCENLNEAKNHLSAQAPQTFEEVKRVYHVWLDSTSQELKQSLN
jgi:hypothetical protein